ncbi:hypothetical protein ABZQ15_25785, partial [Pseudomonas aeruginosa]
MLASSLKRHAPESNLVARATNYLAAKGLAGTPLRDAPASVEQAGGDRWDALQSIMEWTAAENIPDERKLCLIRNAARAALAQPSPKCATCGGTGMVDDGEITCSEGGIPYENGPVKCVKDCPDCKAQPSPAQAEQPTAGDYEEVLADHRRLVREMDVLLNGEACAAKQAMLCDLVSQVEAEVRKSGQPLLVSAERYRWLRNDDNWGADDSEGQGTSKWANLGELSGTDFDAYLDQLRGSNPVMDIDPEHSKAIAKRGRDAIVAQAEGAPVIGCLCGMPMTEGRHSPGGCTSLEEFAPHLSAQAQAKQAERPEVVAYRTIGRHEKHQHPHCALNYYKQNAEDQAAHWRERGCEVSEDELMTVAQHDRIVGAVLRQKHEADTALAWATRHYQTVEQQRDAALARVDALAVQVLKLGGTISFAHYPAAQAGQVPEVSGIGRDTGHPRAVVLYLHKEPTDDDLRAIQDGLRSLAAAPQPAGGE